MCAVHMWRLSLKSRSQAGKPTPFSARGIVSQLNAVLPDTAWVLLMSLA